MSLKHKPVLLEEVNRILKPMSERAFLDCTVNGGGHAEMLLEESAPSGFLVGIDRDEKILKQTEKRLSKFKERFKFFNIRFEEMNSIMGNLEIDKFDGILMDLGLSSIQIDNPERGFSFKNDGPLDMRFSLQDELSAYEIVNEYSYDQLEEIIRVYGEESWSKRIAKNIVQKRSQARISSTFELSKVIRESIPKKFWSKKIDVSTKTFQAIRIAVNQELESLSETIRSACDLLNKNGRVVVISYHSLEDRIVKNTFRELSTDCICSKEIPVCVCDHKKSGNVLDFNINNSKRKFLTPGDEELKANPRSRSAKLRAFERN